MINNYQIFSYAVRLALALGAAYSTKKVQDLVMLRYEQYKADKARSKDLYDAAVQTYVGGEAAAAVAEGETTVKEKAATQFVPVTPVAYHKMSGPEKAFAYGVKLNAAEVVEPLFVQTTTTYGGPRVITEDEFVDGVTNYKQVILTYFRDDQKIADANGDIVENYSEFLGDTLLMIPVTGILYVKNDKTGCVYEIVQIEGRSYSSPPPVDEPAKEENKATSDALPAPAVRKTRRVRGSA